MLPYEGSFILREGTKESSLDLGFFDLVWNRVALQVGIRGMACCDTSWLINE